MESTAPTKPLQIDVFSDVVCPWCFLGQQRLDRVLESLDPPVPVQVTHRPFFLDPNTPPEGDDIPERLRRKYGVAPEKLWARLEAEARKSNLDLDLSKQRFSYPTARAHTLIRHAAAKGTQGALVRALYRANFQEARNIHDPAVLADVAAPHGFTEAEVRRLTSDEGELAATREEAMAAAAAGIDGVPLFVFGERLAVAGAQQENVLRSAIEQAISGIR
jgi:predicted DsbA family dithiol-disulfide isomerase